MKFDVLDRMMRVFETSADLCVLPGMFMVARLDGRHFTRLTKEEGNFEVPFDVRFRDWMVSTTEALMHCGFRVLYGFTESDEISLLLHPDEQAFGRKLRKYNSTLAAEASAHFSLKLGKVATFDCRISQLPGPQKVVDYFRWRSEDASRNALNSWCYWTLRDQGESRRGATQQLNGLATSRKRELLRYYGIEFDQLPAWQRRGVGLYWKRFARKGTNPQTGDQVGTFRRSVYVEYELPSQAEYSWLIQQLLAPALTT
ncbi:tRNA(His) guanylyltransferase Thg1 family protein [Bremerella cremea]|uniref:tRNA(His) guanylyltransferase Thg1 family protein n=1 Tax=Bremerella cremea TaxID=1031537 RepID=UPI0031E7BE8F